MTAIVAVDFDWSIESCDIAPRDLDYERNTEKYGRAMKLTIASCYVGLLPCRMTQCTNMTPSSLLLGMTNLPLSVAFEIERAAVV